MSPEYIFETSWEVCNRVGGIYTVLSTRAATMREHYGDNVVFIGPDVWGNQKCPFLKENKKLLSGWRKYALSQGLQLTIGRWDIPGEPIAVLVDFNQFFNQKDDIYGHFWELYKIDSLQAYGDYDEASMFGYASGVVIESFYNYFKLKGHDVVAHFNEWMTAFGLFYVKEHLPKVGTLFTTHATSIGRSIAGNNKPLYDYFEGYNGDQMAQELNMVSKHSVEKQAAYNADCFTTVSYITDKECKQLLNKSADVLTPNGFELDFVPQNELFETKRNEARNKMKHIAETLFDYDLPEDALFIGTSGRYEYKNKGLDVVMQVAKMMNDKSYCNRQIVFFITVPAWQKGARQDLLQALKSDKKLVSGNRETTHELVDYRNDNIINAMHWYHLNNQWYDNVKIVFVPSYLNGDDGIFNCTYYDLLIGMDLTLFPSYYEPWGYTPLESVAFHVPTLTTNVSGFGMWAERYSNNLQDGVGVVERTDSNWFEMCHNIVEQIGHYAQQTTAEIQKSRDCAFAIAKKAQWKHFFKYYEEAYDFALSRHLLS